MNTKSVIKAASKNRVAVVSPGLLPIPPVIGGSVETVIHQMSQITKDKFDIHIYGPTYRKLPAFEIDNSLTYYRFPSKNYPNYFKLVRSSIKSNNYSIIQVENRPLFVPKTKAASPKSKFITSLHSLIHIEERLIKHELTRKIFSQCDKVLVYSQYVRDTLSKMFPDVADRFYYIHLGTDPKNFRPHWEPEIKKQVKILKKYHSIPENYKVVLFAGRVVPKKGVHILVQAMEKILKEYSECCLVVVGSSWFGNKVSSQYIKDLHKMSLNIAKNIRFTNYVQTSKLPFYFAMADVFICPSQWDEPFGLVNVEAMSSGTPVVASARGGIPEIITNGVTGFLVKNEDKADSFVRPILQLLKNPELADNLGKNGRQRVEEYFNWERSGKQLAELYESLLKPDKNY